LPAILGNVLTASSILVIRHCGRSPGKAAGPAFESLAEGLPVGELAVAPVPFHGGKVCVLAVEVARGVDELSCDMENASR